jgi:hypothetical protein
MKDEKFDPEKMQEIVDRLRAEGRLPTADEFVEAALDVRERYREEIISATKHKAKVRRARPN